MSIHIQRIFVTDVGGRFSQNTPSNLTYDLVIEATADVRDDQKTYVLNVTALELTPPAIPPAPVTAMDGSETKVALGPVWAQPLAGGGFEGVLRFTVTGLTAAERDRLFKYFIVLKNEGPGTDADGAESEVFTLL